MKKNLILFLTLSLLVLSVSCNCSNGSADCSVGISLQGNWTIRELPAATEKKIPPAPAANLKISFRKPDQTAEISGCAGDNRFFGQAVISNKKILFQQMGMTRMMGPNARFEDYFMKALNETVSYIVRKDDVFFLNKDGKTVLILKKEK